MNLAGIIAEHGKEIGATGLAVLVALHNFPGKTYAEIAAMLDMGASTVKRDVLILESLGLCKRTFHETEKGLQRPTTVDPAHPAITYQGESDKPRQDISPAITYQDADPAISERGENIELSLSDPAITYQGANGTGVALYKAETTSSEDQSENQNTARKRAGGGKGTRIPDGFVVTPAMREWALKQAADVDLERETEAFCDYWRGVPGSRGLKLDWPATWRNRMRDLQGRTGGANGSYRRQPDGRNGTAAHAQAGNGYNPWRESKRV